MPTLAKVLVVDGSATSLEALEAVLTTHCEQVLVAENVDEALVALETHRELSLVLVEVDLPDGSGIDLIKHIRSLASGRPPVIALATRPNDADCERVNELGALGYLTKPISYPDISRMLKASRDQMQRTAPRVRSRPVGAVFEVAAEAVTDARREVAPRRMWDVHDLSSSGAFLETKGPLRVGHALHLCLVINNQTVRVTAVVVRLQPPSWEHVAGVGIAFQDFAEGSKELLDRFIASLRDER